MGNAVTNTLTLMHKYCWGLNDVIEDVTGGWSRLYLLHPGPFRLGHTAVASAHQPYERS